MKSIFITFLLIGICCILFYVPAKFAKSMVKMDHSDLSMLEKVLTKIPVFNVVLAEYEYTGKLSINLVADIVFAIMFAVRYITMMNMGGTMIAKVSIILFIASILFLYFANAYIVFIILHDSDAKPMSGCIFFSIMFTLGQYYIATEMEADIAAIAKNKETFG